MLSLATIERAAVAIMPWVLPSPLVRADRLKHLWGIGHNIWLKCEGLHVTGSFKERGAFNAVSLLDAEARKRGVITRSSGNFAQALARAGHELNIGVTVVMPTTAPKIKLAGTRFWGATVVSHGTTHAQGNNKVAELRAESGATLLHPFDHPDVIAGQGTLALEVLKQVPNCRHFFSPVGGGGLLGGCAAAVKQLSSGTQVVGVEPQDAADYAQSHASGQRVTLTTPMSAADGLLAPTVGQNTWPLLQKYVDTMEVVSERSISDAMRLLFELGLKVEPSGATAFAAVAAAAKAGALKGDTACVISGSNVDPERFAELIKQ